MLILDMTSGRFIEPETDQQALQPAESLQPQSLIAAMGSSYECLYSY